jgi:hypothetical protein
VQIRVQNLLDGIFARSFTKWSNIFVKNAQLHDKKWNLERKNSVGCIYSLLVGKEMQTPP